MDPKSHLRNLLQHQLATDPSSVRHLPYVVSYLTQDCFGPSEHLAKWVARVNSLIHSKEPSSRWAGLCLAYKTALLSQALMIESAQSWLGAAMPMFSKNEPLPNLKAAIRLLRVIFTTALHKPEFQRQVSVPNVIKFSVALYTVAYVQSDVELKILAMETLTQLIIFYPTAHRGHQTQLNALATRYLEGSFPSPTNNSLLSAASRLFASLSLTAGKVGSVGLWRSNVDATLDVGWGSFLAVRTTFPVTEGNRQIRLDNDPESWVPRNLDRLRCTVEALIALLSAPIQRAVQVPLGNLYKFALTILSCGSEDQVEGFIDPLTRAMEVAVIPDIHALGCRLLICLTERFGDHVGQYAHQSGSVIVSLLEQTPPTPFLLLLLQALDKTLARSYPLDSPILLNRLTKVVLPILMHAVASGKQKADNSTAQGTSKKGSKKSRQFEGDEVFKNTPDAGFPSGTDREVASTALEVLQRLFRNPNLVDAQRSAVAKTIISMMFVLPRQQPSSISSDNNFNLVFTSKMTAFAVEIGSGTTNVMSKALPFVLNQGAPDRQTESYLELLLHPRIPPLVRTMPHLESLSLEPAGDPNNRAVPTIDVETLHSNEEVVTNGHNQSTLIVPAPMPSRFTAESTKPIPPPILPIQIEIQPAKSTVEQIPPQFVDPKPSAQAAWPLHTFASTPQAKPVHPPKSSIAARPLPAHPVADDEDNEEMPPIDMGSDSDEDEDEEMS